MQFVKLGFEQTGSAPNLKAKFNKLRSVCKVARRYPFIYVIMALGAMKLRILILTNTLSLH